MIILKLLFKVLGNANIIVVGPFQNNIGDGQPVKDKKLRQDALDYHSAKPFGKMKTVPTKPHATQRDLSLAYSPGVAYPCLEIEKNLKNAYR